MSTSPDGRCRKTSSVFRLEYAVTIRVKAPAARLWQLLTTAEDFPRWNSTISSIEGDIRQGHKLALRVPGVDRTFTPKVTVFDPGRRMVWSDGMAPMFTGVRTFELSSQGATSTDFSMTEVFRGVMLPMIRGSLPDFTSAFDTYAADLKRAAEATG